MADFTEVAERVWVARYEWFDVNVTLVGGERGLLMVDTHASDRAAREVVDDIRRLGAGNVVAVVNTHEHFDHTFGNAHIRSVFAGADSDIPIHAHETAAERTLAAGERIKRTYDAASGGGEPEDPHRAEVLGTEILPADHTFSSAAVLDLGDRLVELVHPGRGHTGGDLVVRVPDVDVLLAGDLIEESVARDGVPGFGQDCFPFEWPLTLDIVLSLTTASSVVVPGHGAPVDRSFVDEQRNAIGILAETIRDLATRGVPVDQALDAAEWPFPSHYLADACRRGYEQLPRSQKRLPLI